MMAALNVRPIGQLLVKRAQDMGDRQFLLNARGSQADRWWTYQEALHTVTVLMARLKRIGIVRGDRVGLVVRDPDRFILYWLALLCMDAVVVPLNPGAPWADHTRSLDSVQARWLVQDYGSLRNDVPTRGLVEIYATGIPERVHGTQIAPLPFRGSDEGGVILFTSGTTGDPKPIGLPVSTLLGTAQNVVTAHQFTRTDVGFSPLPLFHVNAEVVGVLSTLVAGASLVVAHKFHLSGFWDTVNRHKVTWINAVPAILNVLAKSETISGPDARERIRFIRSASAPLSTSTLQQVEARWGIPIIETYGLSEAASQVAANPLPRQGRKIGSVGRAAGVAIRVVGQDGLACPIGAVGEIEIKGPTVIDPNWGPNAWALSKLHGGWYPTGDLGFIDPDGFIYLEGRLRDLINRGGEKVFPREVEAVLLNHPRVRDCAVVGRPHAILGEEPVAFVVPQGEPQGLDSALAEYVGDQLSRFKQPAEFLVVDALPQGATGKIQRQQLRNQMLVSGGAY